MTTLGGLPPPDIWARSSGMNQLSDFFMWQVRIRFPMREHHLRYIAHELFCRCLRMCRLVSFLRIGQKLGFGTFSRLFWIIGSRCGVNKQGWGPERFLDFGVDLTDVPWPAASSWRLFFGRVFGISLQSIMFHGQHSRNALAVLRSHNRPVWRPEFTVIIRTTFFIHEHLREQAHEIRDRGKV